MNTIKLFLKRINRYADESVKEVNKKETLESFQIVKSAEDLKGQNFDRYA